MFRNCLELFKSLNIYQIKDVYKTIFLKTLYKQKNVTGQGDDGSDLGRAGGKGPIEKI